MKANINQAPNQPEIPAEIIAQNIKKIADAMRAIDNTRLSRKAIICLIHDQSKIGKRDIEIVLNNLACLEQDWLKRLP